MKIGHFHSRKRALFPQVQKVEGPWPLRMVLHFTLMTRANHNGAVCNNIKVEVKSVLLITRFASVLLITKQGPVAECSDLNIVEFCIFRTFSELKLWFIFIYEHIANQNSVRFPVSIIFYKFRSSKCTQSVCLHNGLDFHFKYKAKLRIGNINKYYLTFPKRTQSFTRMDQMIFT